MVDQHIKTVNMIESAGDNSEMNERNVDQNLMEHYLHLNVL